MQIFPSMNSSRNGRVLQPRRMAPRRRKELTPMSIKADTEAKPTTTSTSRRWSISTRAAPHLHHHDHGRIAGLKVNLPKESAAVSQAKKKTQAITVTNDGKILLQHRAGHPGGTRAAPHAAKAQTPDMPVVVRGDSKASTRASWMCSTSARNLHHASGPGHQTAQRASKETTP